MTHDKQARSRVLEGWRMACARSPSAGRRAFLRGALALAALGVSASHSARVRAQIRFDGYPFSLGVASGSPSASGVVLWTRLAPDPLNGGGVPPEDIAVRWEVATDSGFARIVQSGTATARASAAHSVHVELERLAPLSVYWYRFIVAGEVSPRGRTQTLPTPGASPARLRFAYASCQQYEQGFFGAYRHMVDEDLNLVVHLGDYIYESSWGDAFVRSHGTPEPRTLGAYRDRHALYKTDRDLQQMHARAPWIVVWDDHEVDNDYANDHSEALDPAFLDRRAAAYQAYFEHMPLRGVARPEGPNSLLFARYQYGNLATFHVLDDRQYRSYQACPRPGRGGSNNVDPARCPELLDRSRSLLGAQQESWLEKGLAGSRTRWNILAQQTRMARWDSWVGQGERYFTDGWDGYPAARERLLALLRDRNIRNCMVVGGDVHGNFVGNLKVDFNDPRAPIVATEICGTSITSQGQAQEQIDRVRAENPHVLLAETNRRGYVVQEVTAMRLIARLRVVDNEKIRFNRISTRATFAVTNGRPGAERQ